MKKFLLAVCLMAIGSIGQASTIATWHLMSESAPVWTSDPYFGAPSHDALDPLNNVAISFQGYKHVSTPLEQLGQGYIVYRYQITFSEPVEIVAASMTGFGDYSSGSVMRLLDSRRRVISSIPLVGANMNSVNTINVKAGVARGTTFYLDAFSVSWDAVYVSGLRIVANNLAAQCVR